MSRWLRALLLAACACVCTSGAWAQSAPCNANEDLVLLTFGAAASSNASGSTITWPAGSTANTYQVATIGSVASHTVAFAVTLFGPTFVAGFPAQGIQGNQPNSLDLNMDPSAAGQNLRFDIQFTRPMNKLRFNMYDIDRQAGAWHDVLRITGVLDGNTATVPGFTPNTPANYAITTVAGGTQVDTTVSFNCPNTDPACNIRVDYPDPIERIEIFFVAGPAVAAPTSQRIAFNNFSYCIPKRDLALTKVGSSPTFVAGSTASYVLTLSNLGGAPTVGNYTVTDTIFTAGVGFINPQTPGGGWTCSLRTVTFASDTADCTRATALAGGASTSLTLTVAVSPGATASPITDRAKAFGGGDPGKPTLTATGPVASCNAGSEGRSGGGTTLQDGSPSNAGCAFESTTLVRQALLTVTKTDGTTTVAAGTTTTYTLTFANLGPSDAPGALVTDPAAAGLNCTALTFASNPVGAVVPSAVTVGALQGAGITLTTLNAGSTGTFVLTCGVTATGQ